jgi:hypothetical protein
MSCLISTSGLTQENELYLPEPIVLEHNNTKYVGFDNDGYSIILKLYGTYRLRLENQLILNETIVLYQEEIYLLEQRILLKQEMLDAMTKDRSLYYSIAQENLKQMDKNERKNKIRTTLLASGGVLFGLGCGILIGFLI